MAVGAFDPELRPEAWFDATLVAEGWFDPELIGEEEGEEPAGQPPRTMHQQRQRRV